MRIIKHLRSDWFRYGFETLAIVVGLLVAFALENWNEERKSVAQTKVFLNHIASNLGEDIDELRDLLTHVDKTIQRADSLIESFKWNRFSQFEATVYLSFLNTEKSFHVNRSGIDAQIHSGSLDLLSPDLAYALQQYYALCDKLAERESISNRFIQEKYEPHYFRHYSSTARVSDVYGISNKYIDDPREKPLIDTKKIAEDHNLETLILVRLVQSDLEKEIYQDLIASATSLRKDIELNLQ